MKKIIQFPKIYYILKCNVCKINAFNIYLGSNNPFDIIGYECCECDTYTPLKEWQKEVKEV